MKTLNTIQTLVFQTGGLLLVAGAALPLFGMAGAGSVVLTVGALLFGSMQLLMSYEGSDLVVRRLRRQQIIGALLLILSGLLALSHTFGLLRLGSGAWKLCFAVAALLEGYTAFRLPNALRRAGES